MKKRENSVISDLLIIPPAGLCLAILLSHMGMVHRFGELFSHFRLQYLILSVILLVPYLLLRHRWGMILSMAGLVLSGVGMIPLYLNNNPSIGNETASQVKILLSNVNTMNSEYARLVELAKREQPDMVVIQELNHQWDKYLTKNLKTFPFKKVYPHRGYYGIGIYSSIKILEGGIYYWGDKRFPSGLVRLRIGNRTLTILAAHPPPPIPFWKFHMRNRRLHVLGSKISKLEGPAVLIGDLNVTPWSPYFSRLLNQSGLRDARRGFGILPTWPTKLVLPLRIPIDHCLVKGEIQVIKIKTGPHIGSDHLPLIVTLAI